MRKETPFAEGSIERESCAAGGCSEIGMGPLRERCNALIWSPGAHRTLAETKRPRDALPFLPGVRRRTSRS